jgi:hypothetical protein
MDLKQAMQKIGENEELKKRFQAEPKAVLEEMGINTENLKFTRTDEDGITQLSDKDLEAVAGGRAVEICYIVGVSEDVTAEASVE